MVELFIWMELSIIIVNYNTREFLENCLRSIFKSTTGLVYEVIVVDNNSTDGSLQMIRKMFPQVLLLHNKENLGFSRANNLGYSHSKGKHLLFLNSDTLILDGAIEKMLNYLQSHPQVGIVGPKILNAQHQPTRSYMRFLDIKTLFLGSKYFKFFDVEKYRMHFSSYDFSSVQHVPWVSGACLMVKRNIFQKAGLFDESYFLYFEDMDLCLQIQKLGYQIAYLPTAEIVHLFGGSSLGRSVQLSQVYKNSMLLYFKKNFPAFHYWIAKLYLNLFYKFTQ